MKLIKSKPIYELNTTSKHSHDIDVAYNKPLGIAKQFVFNISSWQLFGLRGLRMGKN